jgi:uncharacterized protein DUF5678
MSMPAENHEPMTTEDKIRALLAEGRISEAKRLLESAGDLVPADSKLREIFAPPKIRRIDERDVDRTGEYRWLKQNARDFQGKWVALAGESLVLSTDTLKELLARLKEIETPVKPLIHRIG